MSFTDLLKGILKRTNGVADSLILISHPNSEQGLMERKCCVKFVILLTQLDNFVYPEEGTGVIAVNDYSGQLQQTIAVNNLDVITCVEIIKQIQTVYGNHFCC